MELFQTLDNSGLDEAAATPDIPPNVELVDARGVSAYAGFRIAADGRAEAEQHVPEPAFIQLTGNFSGNLQSAYGSILKFDLARVPSLPQPLPDVYIQGMNGTKVSLLHDADLKNAVYLICCVYALSKGGSRHLPCGHLVLSVGGIHMYWWLYMRAQLNDAARQRNSK